MTLQKELEFDSISSLTENGLTDISLAVGFFDGVHPGHRCLLAKLLEISEKTGSSPTVVTFSPHPRQILSPETAPRLLLPPERKYAFLHEAGAQAIVTLPFTREFAALSPERFLDQCLSFDKIRVRGICVGRSFRFGAAGKGDVGLLERFSREHHIDFAAVPELTIGHETVSSTAIRAAVAAGDLEKGRRFLGRNPALYGVVESGEHIAGPRLGHPTANLRVDYGIVPPCGVYAAFAHIDGQRIPAATAIGVAPTFDSHGHAPIVRVEIHLIGSHFDLYGRSLALELVQFVRPERRFHDVASLKEQIGRDVETIQKILSKEEGIHV